MKTRLPLFLSVALLFALSSCVKEGTEVEYNYYTEGYEEMRTVLNLSETPLAYENDFPSYYTGFTSPFDKDQATLGRVIFYDKALSADGSISCASCHDQAAGFADNKKLSDGVNGEVTSRNSLALGSVFSFQEYYGSESFGRVPFFWDNRANSVEEQARQTFANNQEMDMQMHQVVAAINERSHYYGPLVKAVRGNTTVADEATVLNAVSVFVNSISSMNSKYDDALSAYFDEHGHIADIGTKDLPGLSAIENTGKDFYMANCASCHGATNGFPGIVKANNGLPTENGDIGIGASDGSYYDGFFKVPTLRNITLTQPYMHDGRFATLDDVLDHYAKLGTESGYAHHNLSEELRNGSTPKVINISDQDRIAIKAFFETFEDENLATEEKYSDPFIR